MTFKETLRYWLSQLKFTWPLVKRNLSIHYAWLIWALPFELISILVAVASWIYFGRMFHAFPEALAVYGGDYTSYIIIGVFAYNILHETMVIPYRAVVEILTSSFSEMGHRISLRDYLLMAGANPWVVAFVSIIITYIRYSIYLLLYLVAVHFFLGFKLSPNANYLGVAIALILGLIAVIGIGLISASMIWIARAWHGTEPITWTIGVLTSLVSSVYFPAEILPEWLKMIAYNLPHTYAIEAIKLALLAGYQNTALMPYFIRLLGYCLVLMPTGVILLRIANNIAKRRGGI